MHPRTRRSQAGFTLTEVMVAFGILTLGGLSSLHLLGVMSKSNGHVSAEATLWRWPPASPLRFSTRLYLPTGPVAPDPGLVAGVYTAPVFGSAITTVGNFYIDGAVASGPPAPGEVAGVLSVSYEVVTYTPAFGNGNPGGVDVLITVDNPTVGGETTAQELGRLMRPVRIAIVRTSTHPRTSRWEAPDDGNPWSSRDAASP